MPLRYTTDRGSSQDTSVEVDRLPYRFAQFGHRFGKYWDLSRDGDASRLAQFGLPQFETPEELADWFGMPVGRLAWLISRFSETDRPENEVSAHYSYRWIKKRSRGWRLIEAPKPILKSVQHKILRDLLDCIPPHKNAHGFVSGRSVVSNAGPHVGQRVLLKLDLENFYPSVSFSRIVSIFRSIGYSREVALWLSRLTTSAVPWTVSTPDRSGDPLAPYARRHLPQGAPTSPALANLSAFSLDVRLSGMAQAFGAQYTRYADDLTFSGKKQFLRSLPVFIPLVERIIRAERFCVNRRKRKILRQNQRQTVTGVVVNDRINVSRHEFDRLKAILANCRRFGPSTQNREQLPDYQNHLRGRIAHLMQLNPERGAKLLEAFAQIDWQR